ncbi:MAG: hypothetical protein IT377_34405 [Polyangiaceae bacterium]|nr:hypothetical protein [Myxococcales bacterium]MCC6904111.1 hypothetical protein [Polyangiaceae bacterium]
MRASLWALPIVLLLATACGGGGLSRARHAFDEGRHADAVDELRALDSEAQGLDADEHARYALIRGLSHFACGDLRAAATWLAQARAAAAADPSLFSVSERGRLDAAWRSMGLMPGEAARITSGLPAAVPGHSEPPHASR